MRVNNENEIKGMKRRISDLFRLVKGGVFCLLLSLAFSVQAARNDSVRFSLMTCSPGELIYELFGHTAIRYQNFTTHEDIVYNYGLFDFDAPHFVWRFLRGETDYELGAIPYPYFAKSYSLRGSEVCQQVLSMSNEEAYRLDSLLRLNLQPQHRVYRYNYFYDNCTTRARDRIEQAFLGKIQYPEGEEGATYRSWVRRYTEGHPWSQFAIDCCLGSEADLPIDSYKQLFLPYNLKEAFRFSVVVDSAKVGRKLLSGEEIIFPQREKKNVQANADGFCLTPLCTMWMAFVLIFLISLIEWKRRIVFWGVDLLLFGLQGLAGLIISFLFFFSTHPTVGSNFLIILFNPLPLIYLPWMIYKVRKRQKDPYDVANLIILTIFVAFLWAIPQKISLVVVPLALILLMRSVLHLANVRKQRHFIRR